MTSLIEFVCEKNYIYIRNCYNQSASNYNQNRQDKPFPTSWPPGEA